MIVPIMSNFEGLATDGRLVQIGLQAGSRTE